jgi:hypothetical protein
MKFSVIIGTFLIQEKTTPNYVVPTSNFTEGQTYLLGVSCKVLSDHPYKKSRKTIIGDVKVEDVIDVRSCVTGLEYTVLTDWVNGYDSLVDANEDASILGHHFPDVKELIGKPYWPRDNSYVADFNGRWADLYKKKCEIVSVRFKSKPSGSDSEYNFILVRYDGKIYRTLFEEWALIEPQTL